VARGKMERSVTAACGARFGAVLGLVLAAVVLWPGAAQAGPYEVEGIAVQAHAADAVTAKAEAVADGQGRALAIVLQRLTRASDRGLLPQVPADELAAMIVNFSVVKEQTSATDYAATLTFRFNPGAVQNLLVGAGVPYTDRQAPPVLVVPVYREAERVFFIDDNPYLEAWRTFDLENTLTPVRLPKGDAADRDVDPEAVLAGDYDVLAALRYRYGVDGVLVGLCETDAAHRRYTCSLDGAGPAGPVALKESYAGGSEPVAVAQAAIGLFLARIEEQWKNQTAAAPGGMSGVIEGVPLRVRVSFSGLQQWQALRARLAGLPGVSGIDIEALNARGALLSLYYAGTVEELADLLARDGMELANAGDHWVLTPY
jgi:Uncharacterized protein conserved in bacteria (DUF2066)